MRANAPVIVGLAIASATMAWSQNPAAPGQNVPLYRVTVIERTVKAVNYQYRSGMPTQIDFKGTVLLPESKGDATVESKAGRTEIDASFERVRPPSRYGNEYLTYVLWAITPEGHAKNLGEVLAGSSDRAKIHVTTDLQAFGMIVTAEPYAAVRQPSDVVVMENEIRPDTVGKIEPIQAKFDLLPRGHYTYNVPADLVAAEGNGPRVPMSQYEELVEVYQAQNAVQIAQAMGAGQYASDTFQRAQELLRNAQQMQSSHSNKNQVIATAREAAQTAEDARAITLRRKSDADVADAKAEAARERERRLQAEAQAQTALAQSSADRAQLERERSVRQQTDVQAAPALQAAPPPPPVQTQAALPEPSRDNTQQKRDLRVNLYRQLGASSLETTDTPRGLVVTIPANDFSGRVLQGIAVGELTRVAAAILTVPGLSVEVDDNGDNSTERADAVRAALIRNGVPPNAITVKPLGNGRPIATSGTSNGRELNRRVEIAISGDAIGNLPYWDRTYSLVPR